MMKIEIAYTLSSDVEKILICKNKQPNQNPNSRDVGIVEFLPKVHRIALNQSFINLIRFSLMSRSSK